MRDEVKVGDRLYVKYEDKTKKDGNNKRLVYARIGQIIQKTKDLYIMKDILNSRIFCLAKYDLLDTEGGMIITAEKTRG